jgi:hypothetical protein
MTGRVGSGEPKAEQSAATRRMQGILRKNKALAIGEPMARVNMEVVVFKEQR